MDSAATSAEPDLRRTDVAIIGGGISGIGTAIKLRTEGLADVLILERSQELGGTWRDNTYPGCACDIPSTLYSFSFAPNPDWTRVFARQPEIQAYVLDIVERYGIRECTSTGTEVNDARWDEGAQRWHIDTSTGPVESRYLVIAAGPLHEPVMPNVPGIDSFTGESFHSSRWRHDLDLTGRNVAVVGTGASAIQFVPEIQPQVGHLTLFQRTPAWVVPKLDRRIPKIERAMFRRVPVTQRLLRRAFSRVIDRLIKGTQNPAMVRRVAHPVGIRNIKRAVKDPAMVKALTPDYVLGCKRPLLSNTYYPALVQPNVTFVPHAISEVRERSIVDSTGVEHAVDTIIYGTGFHVTDLPIATRVHGLGGRSLEEVWAGHPNAHFGTSIHGFPNAFMLFGPNIGTASAFTMLEAQLTFLTGALRAADEAGLSSFDVRSDAQAQWNEEVQAHLDGTVWTAGGCTSYYLDGTGRNSAAWPWTMREMTKRLSRFPIEDYDLVPATARPAREDEPAATPA